MTKALEKTDFEKRFLSLVYQSDVVITAPNIAYHLNEPIEQVQEQLLSLELNGVIQQQMDDQGNTHYTMANRPAPGTRRLGAEAGDEDDLPPKSNNPADAPAAPTYSKPGAKARNVNGLVLNVILPGLGSLVCGRKAGLAMMGLVLLGLVFFFLPLDLGLLRLGGVIPIIAGWIWSIAAGVGLLSEPEGRRPLS